MYEALLIIGAILAAIISITTIIRYLFYTKSEIEKKFQKTKEESDERDQIIQSKLDNDKADLKQEITSLKEDLYEKLLETERLENKSRQELYDRLAQNNHVLDEYNQHMTEMMSQIKQEEKEVSANLIQLVNTIKDELKTDYISRYNDLLTLMGTKANISDFNRLETKFDKVTETITQLKTIVQLQFDKNSKEDK